MPEIPENSESERRILNTARKERYGPKVDSRLADAGMRLKPSDREVTWCPVVSCQHHGCSFVMFNTGEREYRGDFPIAATNSLAPACASTTM